MLLLDPRSEVSMKYPQSVCLSLGLFVSLFVYIFLISCMKLGCVLTKKVTERDIKKKSCSGFLGLKGSKWVKNEVIQGS